MRRCSPTHPAPRLSRTHAEALLVISEVDPGASDAQLAETIGCAETTVKTLLQVLEERGLIRIEGVRDRRRLTTLKYGVDLAREVVEGDLDSAFIPGGGRAEMAEDPRYQSRERRCLGCGADFLSSWAGNRMCDRCKRLAANGSVVEAGND